MQYLIESFSALARTLFKLALLVIGAVFGLALLCLGALAVLFVLLKALLTGRKPVFITTFTRFQQASQQFKRGDWNHPQATGETIEGQVIEVHDNPSLPPPEIKGGNER